MGIFDDDDPFSSGSSTPSRGSRLKGLAQGAMGRVSEASSSHLKPHLEQATSRAVDWAADNPDKLEKAGRRIGRASGGPIVGRLLGKAGGFAGRKASEKAQEHRSGGSNDSSGSFSDPFSDDPFA